MYLDGKGVEKNKEEGVRLVKRSAEFGSADGFYELGTFSFFSSLFHFPSFLSCRLSLTIFFTF